MCNNVRAGFHPRTVIYNWRVAHCNCKQANAVVFACGWCMASKHREARISLFCSRACTSCPIVSTCEYVKVPTRDVFMRAISRDMRIWESIYTGSFSLSNNDYTRELDGLSQFVSLSSSNTCRRSINVYSELWLQRGEHFAIATQWRYIDLLDVPRLYWTSSSSSGLLYHTHTHTPLFSAGRKCKQTAQHENASRQKASYI